MGNHYLSGCAANRSATEAALSMYDHAIGQLDELEDSILPVEFAEIVIHEITEATRMLPLIMKPVRDKAGAAVDHLFHGAHPKDEGPPFQCMDVVCKMARSNLQSASESLRTGMIMEPSPATPQRSLDLQRLIDLSSTEKKSELEEFETQLKNLSPDFIGTVANDETLLERLVVTASPKAMKIIVKYLPEGLYLEAAARRAIFISRESIAEILIKKMNKEERTAVYSSDEGDRFRGSIPHFAAVWGTASMFRMVKRAAPSSATIYQLRNEYGYTPLQLAIRAGNFETVGYIRSKISKKEFSGQVHETKVDNLNKSIYDEAKDAGRNLMLKYLETTFPHLCMPKLVFKEAK